MKNILLFLILCFATSFVVYGQETEEDPFADYSYLWEETKKDKKKKKKKKDKTSTTTSISDTTKTETSEPVTLSSDTTEVKTAPDPIDTLKKETYVFYDSSSFESDIQDDAIADQVQSQYEQDSIKKAQKALKKTEKAEKNSGKEKKPNNDFRAGLPAMKSSTTINGGLTYTLIDGKSYVGLVLAPEINLGKVGIGMDVPILYGLEEKSVRTEIFEDGVGVLRLIRYIRVGQQKVDPIYVKVGELSNTMIGFGGLINNYSNSVSYEKRKVGIHYDVNYKGWLGMEGLYSDFNPESFNLFAVRPYVRPMGWSFIPVARTLEIGATFLSDNDQTTLIGTDTTATKYSFTQEGVSAINIDAGITVLRVPFIQIDLFANYSKLNVKTDALLDSVTVLNNSDSLLITGRSLGNGDGASVGVNFRFNFIADLLSADLRMERLSYSDYYLPQFFDAAYEINKDAKILSLASARSTSGIYGSLTGHILKKLRFGGSLLIPDEITETSPAVVTLNADVDRLFDKYSLHARYFKGGLSDLNDAFKLDDRSLAQVRFVYHLNKFIVAGVDYFYTFTPTENGYETSQYISPYFGMSIQF